MKKEKEKNYIVNRKFDAMLLLNAKTLFRRRRRR